jgi:transposase
LTEEEQGQLDDLFKKLPELGSVYWARWGITEVFDTAASPEQAAAWLEDYRELLDEGDTELLGFFATYDAHREGILAYFAEGKSSGVVEGINNKARVITRRCYGVKSVKTLWQRLCLDLNLAARAVGRTVKRMKDLVQRIRATFLGYYT